jgi:uncharacterized protein involved in outer membrane biogenesis
LEEIALSVRRILLIALAVVLTILVGGGIALSQIDLASAASGYLSERIGRKLTIASARLSLGNPVRIELRGVTVANMPGGSQPNMIALAHLSAEVSPFSLIFGPQIIQHLSLDGARVLLEHGQNNRPNWKAPASSTGIAPKREARRVLPTLLDTHFHDVEIDVRTSGGTLLRTRLDDFAVAAGAPDRPVSLSGDGSYNGIALHADATLPPFTRLHTDTPTFPIALKLTSGTTSLALEGNARDPLNFDGIDGRMTLSAPKPQELLALAGVTGTVDSPLTLAGTFKHQGGLWQLTGGDGTLAGAPLKADLRLQEGEHDKQDAVTVDTAFERLDLNRLIQPADPKQPAGETSLLVDPAPGALLDLHVAAGHIVYRTVEADKFDLKARLAPGVLSIEQLALDIAGGSARSKITIANRDAKAAIDFDGALTGVDAARLAKLMGWGKMPIGGPITSHVNGTMNGATLTEARQANRIFGVMTMDGGTIDRQLVRLASTDVRSLFGGGGGSGRLNCLLIVLDLTDGRGTIAPLRIKTSDGTIVGGGDYDARRDVIDMTIGTQSATTSFFSLDVPVRITGPVSDFSVAPAFGAGARRLSTAGNLDDLPPDLRASASGNGCAAR